MECSATLIPLTILRWPHLRGVRTLSINEYTEDASIGVYRHEHERTQKVIIDVGVAIVGEVLDRDDLDGVLDYSKLRAAIVGALSLGHIKLQETLADRIVSSCLQLPGVLAVHVRIRKPEAYQHCLAAGCDIFRFAAEPSVSAQNRL